MRLLFRHWLRLDARHGSVLLLLLLLALGSRPVADGASLDGAYAQMREAFGEIRTIRHSKGLMTQQQQQQQQQPKPASPSHSLLPTTVALAEAAGTGGRAGLSPGAAASASAAAADEGGAAPAVAPETDGRLAAFAEPATAAGTSDKAATAAAAAAAGSSLLSLLQHQQRQQQQQQSRGSAGAAERRGRTQLGALSQARNASRGSAAGDSRSRFATVYASQNAERPVLACEKGHVACPTPNRKNLVQCIAIEALCNNNVDCYGGEDEDPVMCMFYKQIYLDLDARIAHINDHLKELYRYVNEHTHDAEGHTVVLTEFSAKGG